MVFRREYLVRVWQCLLPLTVLLLSRTPASAQMPPADLCASAAGVTTLAAATTTTWAGIQPPRGVVIVDGTLEITGDVTVATLHARAGSTLRMRPGSKITISDTPPCDAEQYGTGLVLEGRVEIAGTAKTPWTRLTDELQAGATSFSVVDTSGWRAGDRLVVADTREFGPALQGKPFAPEVVTITGVSGKSVSFSPALTHEYPCRRNNSSVCEAFGPVGNLTRDIVIRSQNPQGRRGHVMVTGDASGFIQNAAFVDLGRTTLGPLNTTTNVKGRYALHLHMLHGTGFVVDGAVVEHGKLWGPTVHGTNGHTVRKTVTFDVEGAGVMTEDGTESQNTIEDNLVVLVTGTGRRGDDDGDPGRHGACVWLEGADNYVRRNVVANCGFGFSVWGGSTQTWPTPFGQIREFADNEALSTWVGLTDWYLTGGDVRRFTSWHSAGYDVYAYPTRDLIYTDLIVRGDPRLMRDDYTNVGWWASDYATVNGMLVRPDIRNKRFGIIPAWNNDPSGFVIDHPTLANWWDFRTETPYSSGGPNFVKPSKVIVQSPKHLVPAATGTRDNPLAQYVRSFYPREDANPLTLDQMTVTDYQGSGQSYRLWFAAQAASFVIPTHAATTGVAGMTNSQAWNTAGKAIAGGLAPSNAVAMPWLLFGLATPADASTPVPVPNPSTSSPSPTPSPSPDPSAPQTPSSRPCRFPPETGLCGGTATKSPGTAPSRAN